MHDEREIRITGNMKIVLLIKSVSDIQHQYKMIIPSGHWPVEDRMIGFIEQIIDLKLC